MLKAKLKALLSDVDNQLSTLEKLGIKCAKRNGTVDDFDQKKSIDLATKIALKLNDNRYYKHAFNVASRGCTMNMGPFKSTFVLVIADSFISHKEYLAATKLALLLTPLKGSLKIKTAKQIAVKLKKKNQTSYVNQIYESLQNNPASYAQKAATQILNSTNKNPVDITILLNNVKQNLMQIENIGISCAKRGGSADDSSQKRAIDLATKIGLILTKQGYYKSAFNIASCVCNIAMGPFKAACAQAITTSLIKHKQYELAKNIAVRIAPVKGKLKTETVKEIALKLRKQNQDEHVTQIYKELQKNLADYAQKAAADIRNNTKIENVDVDVLLTNVNQNLMQLEKIGIKCAKRGGSIDDPEQKEAIDLATKIGIALVDAKHYRSAFHIVENVSNIAMGPFKSSCAIAISTALIDHKQYKYAEKVALLISLIKDKIIINTSYEITKYLIQNNHISSARTIYKALKQNTYEYALDILNQLDLLFSNRLKKKSTLSDTVNEPTTQGGHSKSQQSTQHVVQNINIEQLRTNPLLNPHLICELPPLAQLNSPKMTNSDELAVAFQESFGSLIQDNQNCVSWSNKTMKSSSGEPFNLTLTHNELTYRSGGDYNKVTICFNLKTGECTRNKVGLTKEDIEKYTLLFFKIIDNRDDYKNTFAVEK